jgi:hypothetical protein
METTTNREDTMTFNQQLIVGLWNIRNRDPLGSDFRQQTRDWLRQTIRLERKRRSV